jgi:mRNA interferase YafQ
MTRVITRSSVFKIDYKRMQKRGVVIDRLFALIQLLVEGKKLEDRQRDHLLHGNYEGNRECHVEPDWLLIYTITDKVLGLARTGTHSDLFK